MSMLIVFLAVLISAQLPLLDSLSYNIYTYAGTGTNAQGSDGVKASSSNLYAPRSVWGDTVGDVYIVEKSGNCIRRVDADTNLIYEYAGSCGAASSTSGDGGAATSARINQPVSLFIDSSSKVYFTDYSGSKIRLVTSGTNVVTLLAGTGSNTQASDGLVASSTTITTPHGVWVNSNGVIYFTELLGYKVRTIATSSLLGTIAGTGSSGTTGDTGKGTSAKITLVERVYGTTGGIIYLADTNTGAKVRKLDTNNIITTYAGTGTAGFTLDEIPATSTGLNFPTGMWIDPDTGDMALSDRANHRVRIIFASTAKIDTWVGTGTPGSTGDGADAAASTVNGPDGVFLDSTGRFYFACYYDYRVREVYSVTPTSQPSGQPSRQPSRQPTRQPTQQPTCQPSRQPSRQPSSQPTSQPSSQPSFQPTAQPSFAPTSPSGLPTGQPSTQPSRCPSAQPSCRPSAQPSSLPSTQPSVFPTSPSGQPSSQPSAQPFNRPSRQPSNMPSSHPSAQPSRIPSSQPTLQPSRRPSSQPTTSPSSQPSCAPSSQPSSRPSSQPSSRPSRQPSEVPSEQPSAQPSASPSNQPTDIPSSQPSEWPSSQPSVFPSTRPTSYPSNQPSGDPSGQPTTQPSCSPSNHPSTQPSIEPSSQPSVIPSVQPTSQPSSDPSMQPSVFPSSQPSNVPSDQPSTQPTIQPSGHPTSQPFSRPSSQPSNRPSTQPSGQPSSHPSHFPSSQPTRQPSSQPITHPTSHPSSQPSVQPITRPTSQPSLQPSRQPSRQPTGQPTRQPSTQPSSSPTTQPSTQPVVKPSDQPSSQPSRQPSGQPTRQPSSLPTVQPVSHPTSQPSRQPSSHPSHQPTSLPSSNPSAQPSSRPTYKPSMQPSGHPTSQPSSRPSRQPSSQPSAHPSLQPFSRPSRRPSSQPSVQPSCQPSRRPSVQPTASPSFYHTRQPTTQSEQLIFYGQVSVRGLALTAASSASMRSVKLVLPFVLSHSPPVDDGFRDVVVNGAAVGGVGYVLYSSGSLTDNSNNSTSVGVGGGNKVVLQSMPSSQGFSQSPAVSYDWSGRSMSNVGDFNGDGLDDLIIGVPYMSRCYVMFGTAASGFRNLTLGFMVHGVSSADLAGWSVSAAGDVNKDGFADIVIGAPRAASEVVIGSQSGGVVRTGAAYVLFGSHRVFRDLYLDNLSPEEGFVIYGESAEDCFGLSASSAGDVNGDGFDDVIVGSSRISSFYAGGAYIVFGPSSSGGSMVSVGSAMSSSVGVSLVGETWSHCGFSVSGAGDVNGDGFDDVLVGCVPAKGSARQAEVSYLVYGFSAAAVLGRNANEISLSSGVNGVTCISGGGMFVGRLSVDINSDGRSDLLIGSNLTMSAGVGYVVQRSLFKYAPSAQPSVRPSPSPSTVQPSVKPFRSAAPTALPVGTPSRLPSPAPSRPSAAPSLSPTGPSLYPSSHPTSLLQSVSHCPSSCPSSLPTLSPSSTPSISTSLPSSLPSHSPSFALTSVSPSEPPSLTPTTPPTSMSPSLFPTLPRTVFSRPTLQPSVVSTAAPSAPSPYQGSIEITGGRMNRTSSNAVSFNSSSSSSVQYYLWSSSSSTSAYLAGRSDGRQRAVIVVQPCSGCVLTVQCFNLSLDLIDLTEFSKYQTLRDLNVTGHVVVTLDNNQVLRLLNLAASELLMEKNFNFAEETTKKPLSNHNLVLFGCLFGAIAGLGFLVKYYFVYRQWRKDEKVAQDLIARQKPLVTHTHSLYKHTLIGKRQRPSMFEVPEVDEDEPDGSNNNSEGEADEDSLLEHVSNPRDSSDESVYVNDRQGRNEGKDSEHITEGGVGATANQFSVNYDEDFRVYRQRQLERFKADNNENNENEDEEFEDDFDGNWNFGTGLVDRVNDDSSIASDNSLRITWCTAV